MQSRGGRAGLRKSGADEAGRRNGRGLLKLNPPGSPPVRLSALGTDTVAVIESGRACLSGNIALPLSPSSPLLPMSDDAAMKTASTTWDNSANKTTDDDYTRARKVMRREGAAAMGREGQRGRRGGRGWAGEGFSRSHNS